MALILLCLGVPVKRPLMELKIWTSSCFLSFASGAVCIAMTSNEQNKVASIFRYPYHVPACQRCREIFDRGEPVLGTGWLDKLSGGQHYIALTESCSEGQRQVE